MWVLDVIEPLFFYEYSRMKVLTLNVKNGKQNYSYFIIKEVCTSSISEGYKRHINKHRCNRMENKIYYVLFTQDFS